MQHNISTTTNEYSSFMVGIKFHIERLIELNLALDLFYNLVIFVIRKKI